MATDSKGATADAVRRRLRSYNPFVVGLEDRKGSKRDNFEFFDGREKLVSRPIKEFDGHPLKPEYGYFIPVLVFVAIGVTLPLLPLVSSKDFPIVPVGGALLAVFAIGVIVWSIAIFVHLTQIRNEYNAANKELVAANFLTKARGIYVIVYRFKVIVRWRRFMRYTMNAGGLCLIVALLLALYKLGSDGHFLTTKATISLGLFGVGTIPILLFEAARLGLTQGMDPTLALVLMIEEIGGQLLARSHTNVIGVSSAAESDPA